jgi:hypothetical protein
MSDGDSPLECRRHMNREQIATELMKGCPTESREDHEAIAEAVRAGESVESILKMDEVDRWPETYAWLKSALNAAAK